MRIHKEYSKNYEVLIEYLKNKHNIKIDKRDITDITEDDNEITINYYGTIKVTKNLIDEVNNTITPEKEKFKYEIK